MLISQSVVKSAFVLAGIAILSSCSALPPVSEWQWTVEPSNSRAEWNSRGGGRTFPNGIDCDDELGHPNSAVVGVAGFERDNGSDEFMARLDVICGRFVSTAPRFTQLTPPAQPRLRETLTTSSNYSTSNSAPRVLTVSQVPIGLVVYHDGKKHVKNVHLIYGEETNGILQDYVNWSNRPANITASTATAYPGLDRLRLASTGPISTYNPDNRHTDLVCPSQQILTGMFAEQTRRGKIRSLTIFCKRVTNNQP